MEKFDQPAERTFGTILVTGGNGIVGSHVVDALLADPQATNIVATTHQSQKYQHLGTTYRKCDITKKDQVEALLDDIRPIAIIHTISPGPFAPPGQQHKVNYVATKQLLEIARAHDSVQAFVYTSSVEAVALKCDPGEQPEDEAAAVLHGLASPTSAYARTKGAADALVMGFNTGMCLTSKQISSCDYKGMLLTACLRVGGLYGERDEKTVAEILKLVNTFGARIQIGPNKAVHDWVFTENAALAHVLAVKALLQESYLSSDGTAPVNGQAFNITDGEPMLFWDFVRKILIEAGDRTLKDQSSARIIRIPFGIMVFLAGLGEWTYKVATFRKKSSKLTRHHFDFMRKGCWVSIEKARLQLGYQPICDTDEGIRRSVQWFQSHKV